MVYVAKMIIYQAFWKLLYVLILKNKRRQTCTFVITTYNIHLQLSKKKCRLLRDSCEDYFLNRLIKKKTITKLYFVKLYMYTDTILVFTVNHALTVKKSIDASQQFVWNLSDEGYVKSRIITMSRVCGKVNKKGNKVKMFR